MFLGLIMIFSRYRCNLFIIVLVFTTGSFLILVSKPDMRPEQVLSRRLAEVQASLQHLDLLHRARQEDVHKLSQQLGQLLAVDSGSHTNTSSSLPMTGLPLYNVNVSSILNASLTSKEELLRPPTVYNFLPHLMNDPHSLQPAFTLSKGRTGVSVVMGIPTVKRETYSYLLTTLQNLLDSMNDKEAADSVIIVFVAEVKQDYVLEVFKQIEEKFRDQIEAGLIEVISPPASYYPDMNKLQQTLGDPPERVRWRTKQNLDFAFLMMYAWPKGTYYVQLEDDIMTKKDFVSTMKNYAQQKTAAKSPWFVLNFCQLGFIGKLFKSEQLPWMIHFFLMFYNDKPVDWLLDHYIQTKVCRFDKPSKHCREEKSKLWVSYNGSLFQHIGLQSSLKGKVQKLKDKKFGKVPLFFNHSNPEAEVSTDIKIYKDFSLEKAYTGVTYFWGLAPKTGNHVNFKFKSPVRLKSYVFRSCNMEHPDDCFYNTTVEVMPDSTQAINKKDYEITSDGFFVVGKFDLVGLAEGPVDPKLNPVKELRLSVHGDSKKWVILSEIFMEVADGR